MGVGVVGRRVEFRSEDRSLRLVMAINAHLFIKCHCHDQPSKMWLIQTSEASYKLWLYFIMHLWMEQGQSLATKVHGQDVEESLR